jgi:dihydroorotate dehydrogenase (fumarate)/dihydropyrimidine dehydrogenase (NAD+) subunit PreA
MSDLSVEFAGVRFKNPLVTASADEVSSLEKMRLAVRAGIGGITMKSTTEMSGFTDPTRARVAIVDGQGAPVRGKIPRDYNFFSRTSTMTPFEKWKRMAAEARTLCSDNGVVLIASLASSSLDQWVANGGTMAGFGIDMLELNFGCPHSGRTAQTMGMQIGQDPAAVEEITRAVTAAVKIPVIAKLTPQVADVVAVARTALAAGAAAVTITNRFLGFGVDIESGRPHTDGWAGVSGPWVKPLTLRWVSQAYRNLGAQIAGSNGVGDWRDVLEFLMAGARVVQMGTTIMLHGYRLVPETLSAIAAFMDRKGYQRIDDMVGIAARAGVTHREVDAKLLPRRAEVDEALCTRCGLCIEQCLVDALALADAAAIVKPHCIGCGLCVALCPEGAITVREFPAGL